MKSWRVWSPTADASFSLVPHTTCGLSNPRCAAKPSLTFGASRILRHRPLPEGIRRTRFQIVKETGMRSKADVLNFDKPKFKYVLAQTVSMLEEATHQVLGDKGRAKTEMIMKRFEDILAEKQQDLRRSTEEIGHESVAEASQSKPSANS